MFGSSSSSTREGSPQIREILSRRREAHLLTEEEWGCMVGEGGLTKTRGGGESANMTLFLFLDDGEGKRGTA